MTSGGGEDILSPVFAVDTESFIVVDNEGKDAAVDVAEVLDGVLESGLESVESLFVFLLFRVHNVSRGLGLGTANKSKIYSALYSVYT